MKTKWISLSVSETERELNTSSISGLHAAEARRRFKKIGENRFFLFPDFSYKKCIYHVLTQPSVVLLLALSVLFLVFKQSTQGSTMLAVTVIYVLIGIFVRVWMGKVSRIPAQAARAQVRVIRQGQMFLLDHIRLVPGDLIELEQKDIAPCDLRLVSSYDLTVLTYLGKSSKEEYVRTQKSADAPVSPDDDHDITHHATMVYGGSLIVQGQARALVVETGCRTYIGALQGGVDLKAGQMTPSIAEQNKKTAAYLKIGLMFAVLLMLFLSLMLGKTGEGIPMLFSTLMSLCLAHPANMMEDLLQAGITVGIQHTLSSDTGECALIKTEKSTEQLTDIDVLFLLGTQAFSEQITPPVGPTQQVAFRNKEAQDENKRQEMRLVMSENFLSSRENHLAYLRQYGITPILFLEEESKQALTYIMRTGVVEHKEKIAFASRFRAENCAITSDFGTYDAYCGFGAEEIHHLMLFLKKQNRKVALLGNLPRETSLVKHADVSFVCTDDITYFADTHQARESKPLLKRGRQDVASGRMRQYADVLIPCADRHHGGVAAITHFIHTVSDTVRNLSAVTDYLIYSLVLRTAFVLPAILVGAPVLSPAQLMFSGLFTDILLSWLLLTRETSREVLHDRKSCIKLTVMEAIASSAMTLLAFGFIYVNAPVADSANLSLFAAMLLNQLTAFLLRWEPHHSLRRTTNRKNMIIVGFIFLFFFLIAWVFGWLPGLLSGRIVSPYGYLAVIGPLSAVVVSIVTHIYRAARMK